MQIQLGHIVADVVFKDIKHVHLSVHPPDGHVKISAPTRMDIETIRMFSLSRLSWIREQQRHLRSQERETPREYINGESHYAWGKRYLLEVDESHRRPRVELDATRMKMTIRPGWSLDRRRELLSSWYRTQLRAALPALLDPWQQALDVEPNKVFVQHMKTKWGSCNPETRNIRLNTELAKKPQECLEYVLVHELVHLIEPSHGERFGKLMDRALPNWPSLRQRLNAMPIRHEDWVY